jgi:hypothetical protein
MTSASMTFGRTHARHPMPRGAILAGWLVTQLIALARKFDSWQLAQRRPEGPQTVEEVLAWARQIEKTDPGFASDLRAAALRSQGETDK